MYTHEITSRSNGTATVSFLNGEMETYTEQVTISNAVFATEDTPFIPPVFQVVEHERPKVITATFKDDAILEDNITKKLNELNGVVEPTPEPTEEELEAQQAMQAKMEWHQKRSALATMIDDMKRAEALGIEATPEQKATMLGLAQWINANMKQEYYF